MTDYWDEPVYADVDAEARADWQHERPDEIPPHPYEYAACTRCGHYVCIEECE